jgi:hypothetical protein
VLFFLDGAEDDLHGFIAALVEGVEGLIGF